MANNDLLTNAALNGFIHGVMKRRGIVSTSGATYAAIGDAARVFANTIDALIPRDALISDADGTPTAPTTGAIAGDQYRLTGLMESICEAYWSERYTEVQTTAGAANATAAAAIVAEYTQIKTDQIAGA